MIARLICWGYFLGFILLSWILHRKYRQFLDAINMDEDEGREAPRRETPQQLPPTHEEAVASETHRRLITSPDNGEGQRITIHREPMVEFPVLPEQLPSDGNNEEAVLPEHLDPFQTRRW
jgi:hypothetical protein